MLYKTCYYKQTLHSPYSKGNNMKIDIYKYQRTQQWNFFHSIYSQRRFDWFHWYSVIHCFMIWSLISAASGKKRKQRNGNEIGILFVNVVYPMCSSMTFLCTLTQVCSKEWAFSAWKFNVVNNFKHMIVSCGATKVRDDIKSRQL